MKIRILFIFGILAILFPAVSFATLASLPAPLNIALIIKLFDKHHEITRISPEDSSLRFDIVKVEWPEQPHYTDERLVLLNPEEADGFVVYGGKDRPNEDLAEVLKIENSNIFRRPKDSINGEWEFAGKVQTPLLLEFSELIFPTHGGSAIGWKLVGALRGEPFLIEGQYYVSFVADSIRTVLLVGVLIIAILWFFAFRNRRVGFVVGTLTILFALPLALNYWRGGSIYIKQPVTLHDDRPFQYKSLEEFHDFATDNHIVPVIALYTEEEIRVLLANAVGRDGLKSANVDRKEFLNSVVNFCAENIKDYLKAFPGYKYQSFRAGVTKYNVPSNARIDVVKQRLAYRLTIAASTNSGFIPDHGGVPYDGPYDTYNFDFSLPQEGECIISNNYNEQTRHVPLEAEKNALFVAIENKEVAERLGNNKYGLSFVSWYDERFYLLRGHEKHIAYEPLKHFTRPLVSVIELRFTSETRENFEVYVALDTKEIYVGDIKKSPTIQVLN